MRKVGLYLAGSLLAGAMALGATGTASAFHCYVENKPEGAGASSLSEIKPAGKSGNAVLTGAFVSASEFGGPEVDVFRRGQPVDDDELVGLGTLPSQPHENGGLNGVQSLD
jgi:hypothetical protein